MSATGDAPSGPEPGRAARAALRWRHARLRAYFERALGKSASAQERILREARAEDARLAHELGCLLQSAQEEDRFLESPLSLAGRAGEHGLAAAPPAPEPTAPSVLGRFELLERIGHGGQGWVYRARQLHPRRLVALKLVDSERCSERSLRRLSVEADVLARLQHPGIAQVHEAGTTEAEGRTWVYFALELVVGARDLRRSCEERGLDLRARVALVASVCDAVHHAHQRGVVHCDLKPQNVLVDEEGRARVIDFGIARLSGAELVRSVHTTQTSAWLGTLPYMSPEQARGEDDAIDLRTDVWSMGAMLHELACGRPPFELDGLSLPAALRRIARAEPVPIRSRCRELPRSLAAVIDKALARLPERRYASMSELASDLRRFLADEPVLARPPGPLARLVRRARRHPYLATAGACAAIALLVLFGTWQSVRWLALRPHHLELHPERRGVSLVSRLGQPLLVLDGGTPESLVDARLLELPTSLGGGRALAVAFDLDAREATLAGELLLLRAREPFERLWSSADDPPRLPLAPPPGVPGRFEPIALEVADVFPELPGDELVVTHGFRPFSPVAVRVYDVEGQVRYEAWHDGTLNGIAWVASARRLVLTGLDCEARWGQRLGAAGESLGRYPAVVLALEPRDGHRAREFLLAGEARDPTLRWERWVGPVDVLARLPAFDTVLYPPPDELQTRSNFVLGVHVLPVGPGLRAGLELLLDGDGRERARWTDDGWKQRRSRGELVPAEAVKLLERAELPASR